MTDLYFEYAFYRDFVIPAIFAGVALVIILILFFYELLTKWNDKRRGKK